MNIFVTSDSPYQSAIVLDTKRVQKMYVESMQMMATALHLTDNHQYLPIRVTERTPYLPCHQKHPCTLWVVESKYNYFWLWGHANALYSELLARIGPPSTNDVHIRNLLKTKEGGYHINDVKARTPFKNCSLYKEMDLIEAYQKTMVKKWCWTDKRMPRWHGHDKPEWIHKWFCELKKEEKEDPIWSPVMFTS